MPDRRAGNTDSVPQVLYLLYEDISILFYHIVLSYSRVYHVHYETSVDLLQPRPEAFAEAGDFRLVQKWLPARNWQCFASHGILILCCAESRLQRLPRAKAMASSTRLLSVFKKFLQHGAKGSHVVRVWLRHS